MGPTRKNQAYFGGGITRVSDASGFDGQNNLFSPIFYGKSGILE